MMKTAVLGVDFGLSKINSTLTCIETGELIYDYELRYWWEVQRNNWLETNPEILWEVSQKVVGAVVEKNRELQMEIKAIVLSCFGEAIVPVDEAGNHVYPLIGSNDIRAEKETEIIASTIKNYSEITGGNVSAASAASKILWIKNNRPDSFEKAAYFFSLQQYILKKMGVEPVNDTTMASRKMLYDLRESRWSEELMELLGITAGQLGRVTSSATVIDEVDHYGKVSLHCKVPVVIGGHDACSSALGLGISPMNPDNLIGNNSGTWNLMNIYGSDFVNTSMKAPKLTPGDGPVAGSYYFQAAGAVGPVFDWFVRTFGSSLGELSSKAVYDGSCNVRLIRDPMEGNGCFTGLSLTDTAADIYTGMVESFTFPMKDMLGQFENLTEKKFQAMRISAGGAKADNWVQLKANVMNLPMERVANLQASAVGAAINAAVGIGAYKDYDDAISHMVKIDKVFEPQPELVKIYGERNDEFRTMDVKGPCFFL